MVRFWAGQEIWPSTKHPDLLWGPINLLHREHTKYFSWGLKRLVRESDHALHLVPITIMHEATLPVHICMQGVVFYSVLCQSALTFNLNLLTPELNPSAQRCLTRFFNGDLASCTVHFVNIRVKNNKCNNYSFSLLIMYGSTYMIRHYFAILRERS
jgi:hypothetical protein